jgi:hypothetical protein
MFVLVVVGIVATAAPYWTLSKDMQGATMDSSASLWSVQTTTEMQGTSMNEDIGMCSDEMQINTLDCDKIRAARFFVIVLTFLDAVIAGVFGLLASSLAQPEIRQRIVLAGIVMGSLAFFCNFMTVCLVASAGMHSYSLNGPGFAFLALSLLMFSIGAVILVTLFTTKYASFLKLPAITLTKRALGLQSQLQNLADARGCGHVGVAAIGCFMLVGMIPIILTAVSAPYWKASSEQNGVTTNIVATLWSVATTVEMKGAKQENNLSMCGDDMPEDSYACDKIHATRFFLITLLLLTSAATMMWLISFSPARPQLRTKLNFVGACLNGATVVCNFLALCTAASVNVPSPMTQTGAAFACLAMAFIFSVGASVLAILVIGICSSSEDVAPKTASVAEANANESDVSERAAKQEEGTVCHSAEMVGSPRIGDVGVDTEANKRNANGYDRPECTAIQESTVRGKSPVEPMASQNVHARQGDAVTAPNNGPTLLVKGGVGSASMYDHVPPSASDPIVKVLQVDVDCVQNSTSLEAEERPHAGVKMTPKSWFCCAVE